MPIIISACFFNEILPDIIFTPQQAEGEKYARNDLLDFKAEKAKKTPMNPTIL